MLLHVRYCGGCRSGYDRVEWVRSLLAEFERAGRAVCLTEREEEADIRIAVCGCPARCIDVPLGTHVVQSPYLDGISMDMPETAAYLWSIAPSAEELCRGADTY